MRLLNDSTYPLRQGSPGGMNDSVIRPCGAGELGAVVAAQHGRVAAHGGNAVQLGDEVVAGGVGFGQSAEALTGVFIDDGGDLDRAALGGGVELQVDGPDLVSTAASIGREVADLESV